MNKHSVHLVGLELSIFAAIVLLNYNARTKTVKNQLGYTSSKGGTAAIKDMLNNGDSSIKIVNYETPLILLTNLKTEKIINLPVDVKGTKSDALGTFIWIDNGSKFTYTSLIPAVHENELFSANGRKLTKSHSSFDKRKICRISY